jgi:hypothetical protein
MSIDKIKEELLQYQKVFPDSILTPRLSGLNQEDLLKFYVNIITAKESTLNRKKIVYKIIRNYIENNMILSLLKPEWQLQLRFAPIFYINIVFKAYSLNLLYYLEPSMINNGTLEDEYIKCIKKYEIFVPMTSSCRISLVSQKEHSTFIPQIDIYQDGMTLEQMEKIWLIDTDIASTVLDDSVPSFYKRIFSEPNIEIQQCIQIINKANELRLLKFIDIGSLYVSMNHSMILNKLKCIWRKTIYKYMYKDLHNFVSNPSEICIFENEIVDYFDITQHDPIFDAPQSVPTMSGAGCGSSHGIPHLSNVIEHKMKSLKQKYAYPALSSHYNKKPEELDLDDLDTLFASTSIITPHPKTSNDNQSYKQQILPTKQYTLKNDIAAFGKD